MTLIIPSSHALGRMCGLNKINKRLAEFLTVTFLFVFTSKNNKYFRACAPRMTYLRPSGNDTCAPRMTIPTSLG